MTSHKSCMKEMLNNNRKMIITIVGDFDFSLIEKLNEIKKEFHRPLEECILDLNDVTYMDSTAMGVLLTYKEYLDKENIKFNILLNEGITTKLFYLSNLHRVLPVTIKDRRNDN